MRTYFIRISICYVIYILICGCASLEKVSEKIFPSDTFCRIYDLNFYDFHPKLNSFLQVYARKNKGNSFQIRLLGSAEVIWRGIYKLKNSPEIFSVEISSKPASRNKSKLEIKFLGDPSSRRAVSWERASAEFFQAVEEGIKITPQSD